MACTQPTRLSVWAEMHVLPPQAQNRSADAAAQSLR